MAQEAPSDTDSMILLHLSHIETSLLSLIAPGNSQAKSIPDSLLRTVSPPFSQLFRTLFSVNVPWQ